MADKKSRTNDQVNKDSDDNTQVVDAGVPGQIQYPDRTVDAERAAAFAAGKEDTLYDEDDPRFYSGWQNPADNTLSEEQRENNETEPEAMRHEG
jgi:hypothetical protein